MNYIKLFVTVFAMAIAMNAGAQSKTTAKSKSSATTTTTTAAPARSNTSAAPARKSESAQSPVGKWSIGGTVGFTYSKMVDGDGGVSVKIMPDVNYRLNKKLSLGLQLGYSHGYAAFGSLDVNDIASMANTIVSAAADIAGDNSMSLNSVRVAPYVRYDFYQIGKLGFFVEGALGYIYIATGDLTIPAAARRAAAGMGAGINSPAVHAFELNVRPGVFLRLNERFELMAKLGSFGYMFAKEKESETKIHRVGFDFSSFNMLLGMNYHF